MELEDLLEVIKPRTELMLLDSNGKGLFNHTVKAKSAAMVGVYVSCKVLCVTAVCIDGLARLEVVLDTEE